MSEKETKNTETTEPMKTESSQETVENTPSAAGNKKAEKSPESARDADIVFNVGDRVRVHVSIIEGEKERIQVFEGNVIAKNRGQDGTFTVRKTSFGVGVERIFPLSSPKVAKVEVAGRTKLTRSKLYYLRKRTGKAARISEL